jgi:TrpR-related protein YerC/YecD
MAKFNPLTLEEKQEIRVRATLYRAIADLKTYDEVKAFVGDLLNPQERMMLARRFYIAKMLLEDYSYDVISVALRTGHTTIAKVARWLHYGRGGYLAVVKRLLLKELQREKQKGMRHDPQNPLYVMRRYALAFWPVTATVELKQKISRMLDAQRKERKILSKR